MAEPSQRLSDKMATDILEMITLQKRFKPGDKLPNENDFCLELGVSRTTLRAAIQILVSQNILEIKRGKGTFVLESIEDFNTDLFTNLAYSGIRLKDLYEIRLLLEPQTTYFAAKRASDKELDTILENGRILEEQLQNGEDCIEINREFHNSIALAAHNEFMVQLVSIINAEIVRLFRARDMQQTVHKNTLSDHKMIMDYLRQRDGEGAKYAMHLHLRHSQEDYNF